MKLRPAIFVIGCALCSFRPCHAGTLTTLDEIAECISRGSAWNVRFEATVQVLSPLIPQFHSLFIAGDSDRAFRFYYGDSPTEGCHPKPGDVIKASGEIRQHSAVCKSVTIIRHGAPPTGKLISGNEFYATSAKCGHVRLRGTIRSVLPDEIDPNFCLIVLNSSSLAIPVSLCTLNASADFLARLPGSEVEISGLLESFRHGNRPKIGRMLCVFNPDAITFLSKDAPNPFSAPDISELDFRQPSELLKLGRFRTVGTVLAGWAKNHFLIRTDDGEICRIDLAQGNSPRRGAHVEVAGFPETDFYHINLSCAVCRPAAGPPDFGDLAKPISPDELFSGSKPQRRIRPQSHGKTITFEGTVRNATEGTLDVDFRGHTLTVDVGMSNLPKGAVQRALVRITGTCVLDTINWRAADTFPHIRSVFVVTHSDSDILVLASPSWWTPVRLVSVIATLLAVVVGIIIWNVSLRRLVFNRGQALAAETIARTESDLKVYERTRLATELHDSIAQILTGVAFKLETVDRLAEMDPKAMRSHLNIAIQSLKACRGELRNCLWDLRNQALEIPNMNQAIRRTLEQHLEGTKLTVRFSVPRERLSDNTTHEILCIIRELVLNAIRHGHATEVSVAGAIENDNLRFSVADNGCGFNPDNCPGMRDGHHGLQGIRERAAHLNGNFSIQSDKANGTKAVVSIKAPQAS